MIKTKIATVKRINAQHRQNIQKEKERVVELREREEKVYAKIMSYLNSEQDHINDKYSTWNVRQESNHSRTNSKPKRSSSRTN